MDQFLLREALKLNKKRKWRRRWHKVVSAMAATVVFCTTYALILPAITMEKTPICGLEAHEHTSECFAVEEIRTIRCEQEDHLHGEGCYLSAPVCTLEETAAHVHGEECYGVERELTCVEEEYESHTHGDGCFEALSRQMCGLDETEPHAHGEECYEISSMLSCELPEQEGHTHGEDCYTEGELTCVQEETEGHLHGEGCFTQIQELVCTLEETPGHTHNDGCFVQEDSLICTLREGEGHAHTENCYQDVESLLCLLEETQGHTHTEECLQLEEKLVCTLPERTGHTHTEDCYSVTEEEILTCTLAVHIHEDSCYPEEEEEIDFLCGFSEHTHSELCEGESGVLECSVPEHTHTAACKVLGHDPTADVETAQMWEAELEQLTLTGDAAEDLLTVAKSQLGYQESELNCILEEDESLSGYTRYGEWYGTPYGAWNLPFAAFCVHYATDLPWADTCDGWMQVLREAGLYQPAQSWLPRAGELVFLNGEAMADGKARVGILLEIVPATETEPAQLTVVEGDVDGAVKTVTYDMDDAVVMGYGTVGTESVGDERVLSYMDEALRVQLTLTDAGSLPEELALQVSEITEENDPETYYAMYLAMESELDSGQSFMDQVSFFEMQLSLRGEPYQLPEGTESEVEVTFAQPVFPDRTDRMAGYSTFTLVEDERAAPPAMLLSLTDETEDPTQSTGNAGYRAVSASGDEYENAEEGITGLSFMSDGVAAFAVARSVTTVTGEFWERVESTAELSSTDTYMIVSVNGNYALKGNAGGNYQKVNLEMVKGNPGYYTVTDVNGAPITDTALYWTIAPSGSNYTIRSQGTSNYLDLNQDSVISGTSMVIKANYLEEQSSWRLSGDVTWWWYTTTYYLNNSGGSFTRSTSASSDADVLILRLSDQSSLDTPDDVVEDSVAGGGSGSEPVKPDYPAYVDPSAGKEGETAHQGVEGAYYSDPATSQIEGQFENDKTHGGRVLTDKSVIFEDDDYNAFQTYPSNTFGVTMSALSQEYLVSEIDTIVTPVDVMFILDTSGSMNEVVGGNTRTDNMVTAVNKAMAQVLDNHPANRVGVALFAGGAWEYLPLGRYTATGDQFFISTAGNRSSPENGYTTGETIDVIAYGPTLADETTGAVLSEPYSGQGWGTYTQAGIATGAEMLQEVTDTSYTQTIAAGTVYERSYTVQRQPVMILLSDGEPTYSTSNYMDVLNGPHYGDGNGDVSTNNKGIHGYYTILSANYYKRMVGIHYERPALFYTVGISIAETGDTPASYISYGTGDTYKRAVLNPTEASVSELSAGNMGGTNTSVMLRQLLENTYSSTTVSVTSGWVEEWTGDPHTSVPVLKNPYSNGYSYADGAYFGEMDEQELESVFGEILTNSLKVNQYGFVLRDHSAVELIDPIGEGMEVKGAPVLRYDGTNYAHTSTTTSADGKTVTYIYNHHYAATDGSGNTAELSEITVTVTTDENGLQTVKMSVPDTVLPAYSPHLSDTFYYEALPVRLIYQVGLTEKSEAAVEALNSSGGELTFYTNRWEGDDFARSEFKPTDDNPFYYVNEDGSSYYHEHHTDKTDNVTGTKDFSVDCHRVTTDHNGTTVPLILHELGNNGKLTFAAENITVAVEKMWDSTIGQDNWVPVEVKLYSVTGTDNTVTAIQTVTLSAENGWKAVFDGLPALENGFYAVAEDAPAGFWATYGSAETVRVLVGDKYVTMVKVNGTPPGQSISIIITNKTGYMLPETGGIGPEWYTMLGAMLICAALSGYYGQWRKREGRGER